MPHLLPSAVIRLLGAFVFSGWFVLAHAAELGDPVVRSHIGQPLVADIELTALTDPGIAVAVRMASADVYRGANIGMHPILSGLTMSVMRRDGRQFLHITSVRPVESENIHLFLDLAEGGRRNVRAVTLWLTPDPTPAPAPVPKPPAVPVPVPVPAAPAVSLPPARPQAPVVAVEPAPAAPRVRPARIINVPSAGAVCPQAQFSEEQIKSCAAMDYKNGLLSAQIVELEEKVKQLQLAFEGKVAPPPAAVAKKVEPPPAPPRPAKVVKQEEGGFPWLLMSGLLLLLALVGGAVWFFLSRRKGKTVETAAADSVAWYSRLAAPFRRKAKATVAEAEAPKDA